MATVKKLNSSYTIDTTDVIITGNLTVQGVQTSVETNDTVIKDKTITLNDGETGAGVGPAGTGTAGIEVDRGSLSSVGVRWNETLDRWQVDNGGGWANISTTSGTSGTTLEDDLFPVLGGNLNANGYSISSSTGSLIFNGNLQLNYSLGAPSLVSNAAVVYSGILSGGASGVYVVNGEAVNEELITKKRAFGFSILL